MEKVLTDIKIAIVGACGIVTAVFGWAGWLMISFFLCMILDYCTGSAAAIKNGEWASKASRDGAWHKVGMCLVVAASAICDFLVGIMLNDIMPAALPFEYTALLFPLVLCWYIITELGSICENAAALGAPMPEFLKKALAVIKNGTEKAGEAVSGADTENIV